MVGVEHALRRLNIPQPTGTGAGTAGQLLLPACTTIYIERSITIAIGINGFSCFAHHAVQTVFLIKIHTVRELKPIGLTHFIFYSKEVSTVKVYIIRHVVSDVDIIIISDLRDTGDF